MTMEYVCGTLSTLSALAAHETINYHIDHSWLPVLKHNLLHFVILPPWELLVHDVVHNCWQRARHLFGRKSRKAKHPSLRQPLQLMKEQVATVKENMKKWLKRMKLNFQVGFHFVVLFLMTCYSILWFYILFIEFIRYAYLLVDYKFHITIWLQL